MMLETTGSMPLSSGELRLRTHAARSGSVVLRGLPARLARFATGDELRYGLFVDRARPVGEMRTQSLLETLNRGAICCRCTAPVHTAVVMQQIT